MRGPAAPGDVTRAFRLSRWPRLVLLYCAICPPAAALLYLAFLPMWEGRPLLALGSAALSVALLTAGILLLDEPGQHGSASMLIASSALLAIGWLNIWRVGPLPLISVPASPAGTILGAWAMFRYRSSPRERQASNWYFAAMTGFFLAGELLRVAVSVPPWYGFPPAAWWPTLTADHALFNGVTAVLECAGIGFTVSYMILWLSRWKHSHGIARRLAVPVATAASISCAIIIVELVTGLLSAGPRVTNVIYTVEAYLEITVPAAFAVSVLRRRFTRARIADLLLRLRGPERVSSVTDALRDVLEDPALEVIGEAPGSRPAGTWLAGTAGPIGAAGPAGPAVAAGLATSAGPTMAAGPTGAAGPAASAGAADGGRLRLRVTSSSEELAVILADPSLSASDDLVRAAVAATSFALENAQLEAALAGQLREVRESRRRIIHAGIAERRRLERDLHDGIQQGLQGLHVMLAAAEADTADDASRAFIGRIGKELALVIDELRDLAHGVHPGVLSQVGLAEAVRTMAGRYTVAIDVDLPPGRFGEDCELTAYYVIAESITNAIKHARAGLIAVHGERHGDWLLVSVGDDGRGGASADAGMGISGIFDRVRGIGGEAELTSPPGRGTTIRVRIPCA
jgi:signal transduction histidine kinase